MNKKTYSDAIKLLAADDTKRNQTARLNDLYDDIEAALASGVTRSSIVETLAKNGFELPLGSFHSAWHRIRKVRKGEVTKANTTVIKTTAVLKPMPKIEDESKSSIPISGSYDPTSLNKIMASRPDLAALARLGRSLKDKI